VLFDEPELHLNPGVSRQVLEFLRSEYALPKHIQFIICTHSPEIVSGAFSSDDCLLLHLKSPTSISRVGRRALDEYSDTLQRLGTSVSESLL
jgi:predicted ATP-dependent endonuclease of OLD family